MKLAEVWDFTARVESFYIKDGTAMSLKPMNLMSMVIHFLQSVFYKDQYIHFFGKVLIF